MKIKLKKLHPNAVVPRYARPGDAGLDLVALSQYWDSVHKVMVYGTGVAVEIPEGYVGLVFPRSSVYKTALSLSNSVGVVDSGYRGEIKFMYRANYTDKEFYRPGDKIGQLVIMPYPTIEFEEVTDLSETERGTGGWGSSGR